MKRGIRAGFTAIAATALWLSGAARSTAASDCVGDCDGVLGTTTAELRLGVEIALGASPVGSCSAMDPDQRGAVAVPELVRAVRAALAGCVPRTSTATPHVQPTATSTETPPPTPTSTPPPTFAPLCDLPGSVQSTADGIVVVPGGPANAPDLRYLHLPVGFCAHFYAHIGNTRQLRFAPGGELFVASPTTTTTGGVGPTGKAAIIVLPDDDHDGVADSPTTFLGNLPSTQGLLFTDGYLYYQDRTRIMRVPYASGDRQPSGASQEVANITVNVSALHWPKAIDIADDGTIYVTNGGDQSDPCSPDHPFRGGILKLDGSPGGAQVAKGMRNPISLRCLRGHNMCFAVELARDFTAAQGGREKLAPIRQGDDWGFPCCATTDLPYPDILPVPDCSGVTTESGSFLIGDTPFDVDFELGKWPAPWNHRAYVPLHGAYGSWQGAKLVAIAFDPDTGELMPGSTLPGGSPGALKDFATGWDDGTLKHGRPSSVAFAPDGRLFLGNDNNGDIVWIAPMAQ